MEVQIIGGHMPQAEKPPAWRWSDFKEVLLSAWPDSKLTDTNPHRIMTNLMSSFGSSLSFTQCIKIEYRVSVNQTQLDRDHLNSLLRTCLPKSVELRCLEDGIKKIVEINSPAELEMDYFPCEYSVETMVFEVCYKAHV